MSHGRLNEVFTLGLLASDPGDWFNGVLEGACPRWPLEPEGDTDCRLDLWRLAVPGDDPLTQRLRPLPVVVLSSLERDSRDSAPRRPLVYTGLFTDKRSPCITRFQLGNISA